MIRYTLLGIFFFLIALVVTLPANLTYGYWKQYLGQKQNINVSGIEGSVWSGSAAQATIQGQRFHPLEWTVHPLSLLLGKAELGVEFTVEDGFGKGNAGYSLLGGYYLKDVEAWLPLTMVARFVNLAALRPGGKININLEKLHFDGKSVTAAEGKLAWLDAEITVFQPVPLGNYEFTLHHEEESENIVGVLSDKGGPMEANGRLSLTPAGDYEFNAQIAVRDNSRQDLKQALQSMGRPDREGKVKLSQKGNLKQLGIF